LLTIKVYRAGCGLWRGPGIKAVGIYQGVGANAKNVTSLFTLLSVLGLVFILIICVSFNSIILFCNISLRMFVLTLILQFKPTTDENPY